MENIENLVSGGVGVNGDGGWGGGWYKFLIMCRIPPGEWGWGRCITYMWALRVNFSNVVQKSLYGYVFHIIYRVVPVRIYISYNLQGCQCKGMYFI